MSVSEPPQAKTQAMPCPINDLADEELLRVFQHLPPLERLFVSEVCKRWNELSRIPWRDVIHLILSDIPGERIRPIVNQCPNLQTVFAAKRAFRLNELHIFSGTKLSSLKLYDCSAVVRKPVGDESVDLFSSIFARNFANADWEELVCDDLRATMDCGGLHSEAAILWPSSLKRLQLSGMDPTLGKRDQFDYEHFYGELKFFTSLGRLQNLTCLILSASISYDLFWGTYISRGELRQLQSLTNLREFLLGGSRPLGLAADFSELVHLVFGLQLEVLFLNNVYIDSNEDDLAKLFLKHPTLKILCITGCYDYLEEWEHIIPARRLYPNGFGSDPLPLLHVFLGKEASEKFLFAEAVNDALKVYPITDPLSEFLEKAEIAPIFEGVWIAAQIKEGAKYGAALCEYDGPAASIRQVDNA